MENLKNTQIQNPCYFFLESSDEDTAIVHKHCSFQNNKKRPMPKDAACAVATLHFFSCRKIVFLKMQTWDTSQFGEHASFRARHKGEVRPRGSLWQTAHSAASCVTDIELRMRLLSLLVRSSLEWISRT